MNPDIPYQNENGDYFFKRPPCLLLATVSVHHSPLANLIASGDS